MAESNGYLHRSAQLSHSAQDITAVVGRIAHETQLVFRLKFMPIDASIELAIVGVSHDHRPGVDIMPRVEFLMPDNGKLVQVNLIAGPDDLLDRGITRRHFDRREFVGFPSGIFRHHGLKARVNAKRQTVIAPVQVDENGQLRSFDVGEEQRRIIGTPRFFPQFLYVGSDLPLRIYFFIDHLDLVGTLLLKLLQERA